jgi:hypothetical protein
MGEVSFRQSLSRARGNVILMLMAAISDDMVSELRIGHLELSMLVAGSASSRSQRAAITR